MQEGNIPSTFPWDFVNQKLNLVWTKPNNAPSWKGPHPAVLPVRAGPPAKHQITSHEVLPCLVTAGP